MSYQDKIAKVITDFDKDEVLSDWYGMTLHQILEAMEAPGVIVLWGCWDQDELDTVFYDELA